MEASVRAHRDQAALCLHTPQVDERIPPAGSVCRSGLGRPMGPNEAKQLIMNY